MYTQEFLYDYNSVTITACLFALILLFNEFGFRIGRFVQGHTDDEVKALTGSIQASVLGLLALLLGFTFSMSMQRFDNRSLALIDEANAIGTAMLRVHLLPPKYQQNTNDALQRYVDLRISLSTLDHTQRQEREKFNRLTTTVQNELWELAVLATNDDPRPVTTGAFVNSLNQMIDSQGRRNALLRMHVPEVVLLLLFTVFLASGSMLGYSSGLSGRRVLAPAVLVSLLIALIVFIIIDLDRPKRGLIQVDQSILLDLKQTVAH